MSFNVASLVAVAITVLLLNSSTTHCRAKSRNLLSAPISSNLIEHTKIWRSRTACSKPPAAPLARPLLRNRLNLLQHLFHPPANLFPLFSQLHRLAPQHGQLFVTFLQLLPYALGIAFRYRLRLPRRFVHLDSAVNLLFQRLKIVSRNLLRHLFHRIQRHECFPRKHFKVFRSILHLWIKHRSPVDRHAEPASFAQGKPAPCAAEGNLGEP